jgi:hypothetical protein
MHFLTFDEKRHSTMWNFQRIIFAYFRNFIYWLLKWMTIFCQLYFIFSYGYTCMYCSRNKQILKYVIKTTLFIRHISLCFVVCMYGVTSVTTLSLTETILIATLYPFCCQESTTCKHLCFPIICNFKEL